MFFTDHLYSSLLPFSSGKPWHKLPVNDQLRLGVKVLLCPGRNYFALLKHNWPYIMEEKLSPSAVFAWAKGLSEAIYQRFEMLLQLSSLVTFLFLCSTETLPSEVWEMIKTGAIGMEIPKQLTVINIDDSSERNPHPRKESWTHQAPLSALTSQASSMLGASFAFSSPSSVPSFSPQEVGSSSSTLPFLAQPNLASSPAYVCMFVPWNIVPHVISLMQNPPLADLPLHPPPLQSTPVGKRRKIWSSSSSGTESTVHDDQSRQSSQNSQNSPPVSPRSPVLSSSHGSPCSSPSNFLNDSFK